MHIGPKTFEVARTLVEAWGPRSGKTGDPVGEIVDWLARQGPLKIEGLDQLPFERKMPSLMKVFQFYKTHRADIDRIVGLARPFRATDVQGFYALGIEKMSGFRVERSKSGELSAQISVLMRLPGQKSSEWITPTFSLPGPDQLANLDSKHVVAWFVSDLVESMVHECVVYKDTPADQLIPAEVGPHDAAQYRALGAELMASWVNQHEPVRVRQNGGGLGGGWVVDIAGPFSECHETPFGLGARWLRRGAGAAAQPAQDQPHEATVREWAQANEPKIVENQVREAFGRMAEYRDLIPGFADIEAGAIASIQQYYAQK